MKCHPLAILFDMDGVLIDSFRAWLQALNTSLKKFNLDEVNEQEFKEKFWGHDLNDNLKRLNLDKKVGDFCISIFGNFVDKIEIFPETKMVLEKLNSFKKGLITNTPRGCISKVLRQFNLAKYFDVVVTSDEVKMGKPSPEMILKACHAFQIEPSDALLVGDTESDVLAGKKAGCIVVGLNVDADIKIKKLSELLSLLHCYKKHDQA